MKTTNVVMKLVLERVLVKPTKKNQKLFHKALTLWPGKNLNELRG